MTDIYINTNTGQGDTYIIILDKETFDWAKSDSPIPEGEHSATEPYPDIAIAAMRKADPNTPNECYISSGSYWNDRTLGLVSTVPGYKSLYFSTADVMKDIQKTGDKVIDSIEGCIY